jgi:hypothetical protein
MKKIAMLFLTCIPLIAWGQKNNYGPEKFAYKNSLQLELLGHGAFYSLNYERSIVNLAHTKTSIQLGAAYAPRSDYFSLYFPICSNQLISFNRHHIELGLGFLFSFHKDPYSKNIRDYGYDPFYTFKIGYRYQKPSGRMQYKILFTPVLEADHRHEFTPWGALSVGYCF